VEDKKCDNDMIQELKILIISFSGMGDVLLFTPALHILRQRLNHAKIVMLVKSEAAAQVLRGNPDIDQIEVFDPKLANILKNFCFYFKQRKRRYDVSICTFPALTALNNLSTWFIGAKHRWNFHPPYLGSLAFLQNHTIPYHHGRHRTIYNLQLVEAVIHRMKGCGSYPQTSFPSSDFNNTKLFYYVSAEERAFVAQFIQKRENEKNSLNKNLLQIGIHPGSGEDQSFKRWSEEKYAALASLLQTRFNAQILLFGGPEEVHIAERIAAKMPIPPLIITGKMSLRYMAALMEHCRLFISNDSGLMHLAAALGTQVIGIFGPTDETNTSPIGKKDRMVFLPHLNCKAFCRQRFLFHKRCSYQYRCLKELDVRHVLDALPQL